MKKADAPDDSPSPARPRWFRIRGPIPLWLSAVLGLSCIVLVFALWWFITWGENSEDRIVSKTALPSPAETFFGPDPTHLKTLWFDRALTRNAWVTLKRVALGFAVAAMVGVPLGVLAGCFPPIRSFLAPLIIFGRNIPLAALIPLTFFFFGIGELQKVIFIFIACVAFVIADAATAVSDVGRQYIDTAYTLGANRRHVILKVLFPLAMPSIFNSARLLFGLAFGYIMLAELVRLGSEEGGLGNLILVSQRQGPREHIYLIILIIPLLAFVIDRLLYWVQRSLFPYRYGGVGVLNECVRFLLQRWDDVKRMVWTPETPFDQPRGGSQEESQ